MSAKDILLGPKHFLKNPSWRIIFYERKWTAQVFSLNSFYRNKMPIEKEIPKQTASLEIRVNMEGKRKDLYFLRIKTLKISIRDFGTYRKLPHMRKCF